MTADVVPFPVADNDNRKPQRHHSELALPQSRREQVIQLIAKYQYAVQRVGDNGCFTDIGEGGAAL